MVSYKFGDFYLDVKKQRLMKGEQTVSLTPKEFDILLFLIERSHRAVSKYEILEAVWSDTFVEEATLTRNISWLRKKITAYSDDELKIIETIPKRGYRFLPEISKIEDSYILEERVVQELQIEEIIEIEPSGELVNHHAFHDNAPADVSRLSLPAAKSAGGLSPMLVIPVLLIMIGAIFIYYKSFVAKEEKITLAAKVAPFSGLPGRELSPAFSPDGKQMAFAWDGGVDGGNLDIYVKLISGGDPVRLTSGATDEINPVFSPDGGEIVFVRVLPAHCEVIAIPALGGGERRIYEEASFASVSFSPDGSRLAIADLDDAKNEPGIFLLDLSNGKKKRLTKPSAPLVDHTPRFSPDGKNLAFIRYFSSLKREIFIVPVEGGEPRQITADDVRIYGLAWASGGESLFFTSFRVAERLNLWQIPVSGASEPRLISTGADNLGDLALSPDGRQIAYVEETTDENIWEITPGKRSRPLIRSSRADHSPQFSPDGKQIVFASDRTGNYEIWIADASGKNQRQLTALKGSAGSPRFSPDGQFIVYDAQTSGSSEIYMISINGGTPVRLTDDAFTNALPAWSADGRWIFFLSNRSGDNQIWKMPAGGGEAQQITKLGAFEMSAAPNKDRIIYSKGGGKAGLWQVGTEGVGEQPLAALGGAGERRSWFVAADGVYFVSNAAQPPYFVQFFDFESGLVRNVVEIEKQPLLYYSGLAVAPDKSVILYAREDQTEADIMLAEIPD